MSRAAVRPVRASAAALVATWWATACAAAAPDASGTFEAAGFHSLSGTASVAWRNRRNSASMPPMSVAPAAQASDVPTMS